MKNHTEFILKVKLIVMCREKKTKKPVTLRKNFEIKSGNKSMKEMMSKLSDKCDNYVNKLSMDYIIIDAEKNYEY